jgi:hypothetical protein
LPFREQAGKTRCRKRNAIPKAVFEIYARVVFPSQINPMKRRTIVSLAACVVAASLLSCNNNTGGSNAPPAVEVVYSLPTTITGNNAFDDAALVGRKQVGLQFLMRKNVTLKNIVLSHWRAGNNASAQSQEFTLNRPFSASPSQALGHTAYFEIPDSAAAQQCDGIYYTFAATYQVEDQSTPSSFFGQARLILPTKKLVGSTIEEGLCAQPPPPGS